MDTESGSVWRVLVVSSLRKRLKNEVLGNDFWHFEAKSACNVKFVRSPDPPLDPPHRVSGGTYWGEVSIPLRNFLCDKGILCATNNTITY